MSVNRQYKDTVFSLLFSNPDVLRELYSAIGGVTLPPDTPIEINTLEGALYRKLLNDVSFVADKKLILLAEHQSTINPNMALRMLKYVTTLYELIVADKNVLGSKKVTIPVPEFFVLYRGNRYVND